MNTTSLTCIHQTYIHLMWTLVVGSSYILWNMPICPGLYSFSSHFLKYSRAWTWLVWVGEAGSCYHVIICTAYSQWALCMKLSHGIKSALLDGKLRSGTSRTKKSHAWPVEIALFWRLLHFFAIQHGGFCTMWRYHAKSPFCQAVTKWQIIPETQEPTSLSHCTEYTHNSL